MKNHGSIIIWIVLLTVVVTAACLSVPATSSPFDDQKIQFEPKTLPEAQVGIAYEADIRITQNNTPVMDFEISDGALPQGLALEKVQGEDRASLSGTPQEDGTFTFTISVRCFGTNSPGQVGEKKYTLIVGK